MAINFPDSPSVNDTVSVGDHTWIWDGTTWKLAIATAIAPAGSNTQVQYNSSGSFAGSANFTFDGSAAVVKGTVTVGVDDTGHDVKFFGAAAGSHLLWDESENRLDVVASSGAAYIRSLNGTTTTYIGSDSSNTALFGTSSAHDVRFISNDTEHMRLTSGGRLSIGGTTNPGTDARFLINDAANGGSVYVSNSGATAVLQKGYSDNGGSQTLQFVIRGDGDFESRSNSYGAISDERAKTNIADANSHTEDLKKLRVVNYQLSHQWDEEKEEFAELEELGERHIGLIAQEVEQHLPKLVKDNDGPKSVKYSLLVPMLLQTIQELLDRVETLEND